MQQQWLTWFICKVSKRKLKAERRRGSCHEITSNAIFQRKTQKMKKDGNRGSPEELDTLKVNWNLVFISKNDIVYPRKSAYPKEFDLSLNVGQLMF